MNSALIATTVATKLVGFAASKRKGRKIHVQTLADASGLKVGLCRSPTMASGSGRLGMQVGMAKIGWAGWPQIVAGSGAPVGYGGRLFPNIFHDKLRAIKIKRMI
jgi:hypothetical protein